MDHNAHNASRLEELTPPGLFCILLSLLGTLLAIAPARAADGPATTVERFYATYIPNRHGGLPSGAELERLQPFLSQRLHRLIVDAWASNESWAKRHPDEPSEAGEPPVIYKPPFVDGDYFSSVFEGPKTFKVERAVGNDARGWKVHVQFWHDADEKGWKDVVVVRKERGRYVIDDVLFSGAGPFNPEGRLSEILKARDED
jgi:hypothetical protein